MKLLSKMLLYAKTLVVSVDTQRGNAYVIDHRQKIITVYKKVAANGSVYHMNFLPKTVDGYEAVKPDGLTLASGWWQCPNSYDGDIRYLSFDVIRQGTGEVVATYTLIFNWKKEGGSCATGKSS